MKSNQSPKCCRIVFSFMLSVCILVGFSRDDRSYFFLFSFFLQDGSGRWVRSLGKGLRAPWGLISSVDTG